MSHPSPPGKPSNSKSDLKIEYLATTALTPDPNNARRHTDRQIKQLCHIIGELGWSNPIVVDEACLVIAGHARLEAAKRLGMQTVPVVRLTHLTPAQKRALAIADNKMTDESDWDGEALRLELVKLADLELDFDVELTGFSTGEIDIIIDGGQTSTHDPADVFEEPDTDKPAVTQPGDLWQLGSHRLLCGDALDEVSYEQLLGGARADMVFSDPPYNVPVRGHVSGLGRHKHPEFAMASGEMSPGEFRQFLATAFGHMATFSRDGSIHFHCIDWRGVQTVLAAGRGCYTEVKNICTWVKTNAGMGSLYRSQTEFIVVFKKGTAPHQNNIELGRHGRNRSNVWTYPGSNGFGPTRDADLADHPTVKPVALVADAIRDVTKRGALVLDAFSGSGTTILAAERTGRRAAALEIEPRYVDVAVRRWQTLSGKTAVLDRDGRTFDEVRRARSTDAPSNDQIGEA
jgi:16S rRNA G966 N2-methylase RsmD